MCWHLAAPLEELPLYVVKQGDALLSSLHCEQRSRPQYDNQSFLRDVYNNYNNPRQLTDACLHGSLQSFTTCSDVEHFRRTQNFLDLALLCPLARAQAACLDCLWQRWGFLLQQRWARGAALTAETPPRCGGMW